MTVSTIPKIPKEVQNRIIAVTMVGSPNCPDSVKQKCRSYCNKGDGVRDISTMHISRLTRSSDLC